MSKTGRPYEPDQIILLPPSVKDRLPAGHLAHFVSDMAEKLDLDAIVGVYEREKRGQQLGHVALDGTKMKVETFIPPERRKHGDVAPPSPRGRIPDGLSAKDLMRRKPSTICGRTIYAKLKKIVEPVFGQIKQAKGKRRMVADLHDTQHAQVVAQYGLPARLTEPEV